MRFSIPFAELLLVVGLVMTCEVVSEFLHPAALFMPQMQNYL